MTADAEAFDWAVRMLERREYRRRADISLHPVRHTLNAIRQLFNEALAVEGQHITTHAPHQPFYFDFIESDTPNALAFRGDLHSFIGVTIPLIDDTSRTAATLSASESVKTAVGLPAHEPRPLFHDAVFWMVLSFIVTHEYTHHVHGHLSPSTAPVEEIVGGSVQGSLARQAQEADADGYATYFSLKFWFSDGRPTAVTLLSIEGLQPERQEEVVFACFLVALAGFTFLREPEPLDGASAYSRTHPPQTLRLHLLTRFAMKWCGETNRTLHDWMTQSRFERLMQAATASMWTGGHASAWRAQAQFLATDDGIVYRDAVISELDKFRASLR